MTRHRQHAIRAANLIVGVVVLIIAAGSSAPPARAAAAEMCCGVWTAVPSPTPTGRAVLSAVSSLPRHEAWAVGFTIPDFCCSTTVALHESDGEWTRVATVDPHPLTNRLDAVAGVGSNDVWAVGSGSSEGGDRYSTLIEHWNGDAWTAVASPNRRMPWNSLSGIWASSETDAWAVGESQGTTRIKTLIEHWDGERWSLVPSPNPETYNELWEVSGSSPRDVWAVGAAGQVTSNEHALVLHWDGSSWTTVHAPSPGVARNNLESVVSISRDNAWAVGYAADEPRSTRSRRPLAVHWDGVRWRVVPTPAISAQLQSVAAAKGRVLAAGYREIAEGALMASWTSGRWRVVRTSFAHDNAALAGVSLYRGAATAWAVGFHSADEGVEQTLIEHPSRGRR